MMYWLMNLDFAGGAATAETPYLPTMRQMLINVGCLALRVLPW